MNLTQEGNEIYSASRLKVNKSTYVAGIDPVSSTANSFKYIPSEKELLDDKLRTMPDRGLTMISKSFVINWRKLTNILKIKNYLK